MNHQIKLEKTTAATRMGYKLHIICIETESNLNLHFALFFEKDVNLNTLNIFAPYWKQCAH